MGGVGAQLIGVALLRKGAPLAGVALLVFGVAAQLVGVAALHGLYRGEGPAASARLLAWLRQR